MLITIFGLFLTATIFLHLRVLESKHKDFKVGDLVMGYFGWRNRFVHHGDESCDLGVYSKSKPYIMPDFGDLSPSLGVGMLGMPG